MAEPKKDVIYIDLEDDITSVIDKVRAAGTKIVAIVPPKRSAVLQSIVNMKLLKRAADESTKKVVLISKDAALIPLAASVRLHVADTLQSRPEIPAEPMMDHDEVSVIEDDQPAEPEPEPPVANEDDFVLPPVDPEEDEKPAEATPEAAPAKKEKHGSKLAIPNFDKFRLKLVLGVLAFLGLIVFWVLATMVLPKAEILVKAQASRLDTKFNFTVDTEAESDDLERAILAGEQKELKHTMTEKFTATGRKDIGNKATGTMTVANCESSETYTLPAGTTMRDPTTNLDFKTNSAVELPAGTFDDGGATCTSPTANVPVTAAGGGDKYNLAARTYEVQVDAEITAQGSQMTGGTTKIATVVTAKDIADATKRLLEQSHTDIQTELAGQFTEGQYVITDSFRDSHTEPVSTHRSGQEASEPSVSAEYTFTLIGVNKTSIEDLTKAEAKKLVLNDQQSVLDAGLDEAVIKQTERPKSGTSEYSLRTDAFAGPDLDTAVLAEEISGKRYGEVVSTLNSKPGVTEVQVNLSPFWVSKAPKPSKINITVEVSDHALQ